MTVELTLSGTNLNCLWPAEYNSVEYRCFRPAFAMNHPANTDQNRKVEAETEMGWETLGFVKRRVYSHSRRLVTETFFTFKLDSEGSRYGINIRRVRDSVISQRLTVSQSKQVILLWMVC